ARPPRRSMGPVGGPGSRGLGVVGGWLRAGLALLQVGFIVDVVDADGDGVLGHCRFVTGSVLDLPIQTSGLATNATSGTAVCPFNEVSSIPPCGSTWSWWIKRAISPTS